MHEEKILSKIRRGSENAYAVSWAIVPICVLGKSLQAPSGICPSDARKSSYFFLEPIPSLLKVLLFPSISS